MTEILISLREAIEAIESVPEGNWTSSRYIKELEKLDPVQPEIIRCKECVYADENYHCDYMTTWNDGDCFCCYGKRRTDGRFDKQTGGD